MVASVALINYPFRNKNLHAKTIEKAVKELNYKPNKLKLITTYTLKLK